MSIEDKIKKLEWEYKEGKFIRIFEFSSFKDAVAFIDEIAEIIEKRRYYPSITINATKVKITFAKEQITEKDLVLASEITKVYDDVYFDKEENKLLQMEDEKEKAKHRTRGPYRKSSSVGLKRDWSSG